VLVADGRGRGLRLPGLTRWLVRVAPSRVRGVVGVALVGDARMRALNRTYRGVDRTTDVLSFPSREPSATSRQPPVTSRQSPAASHFLGDIVVARGVARRQAKASGHAELIEWRILALHGLLHLLGYDHERDGGRMQRMEQRLRRKGGLAEGLIERHAG